MDGFQEHNGKPLLLKKIRRIPMSKHIILYIFILIMSTLTSCNKMEWGNPLVGQWQLTEWKDTNGKIIADKKIQIYYRFQLGIVAFHKVTFPDGFIHSAYEEIGNNLRIHDPFIYKGMGHDSILSMDTLSIYGVPHDGLMNIQELSSKKLILHSPSVGTLSFRKY